MHTRLQHFQKKTLQDLHMTLYTEPGLPGQLPHIFSGLRSLDLFIIELTDVDVLFQYIRTVGRTLGRFSLSTNMLWGVDDRIKTWAMGEQEDVTRGMPM
jgi:hypothetical protein